MREGSATSVKEAQASVQAESAEHDDFEYLPDEAIQTHGVNRKYFKGLLRVTETDLVEGSWWFVWGSVLSVLIPVFPLISLYTGWWPDPTPFLPKDIHLTCYCLLIIMGIFFTIGSYLFLRAVHPRDKILPLLPSLFITDELFGMFNFFIGILVCIPMTAMYAAYEPSTYFRGSVVITIFFTIITGCACFVLWRDAKELKAKANNVEEEQEKRRKEKEEPKKRGYLVPLTECLCCGKSDHYSSDLLILSWLALIGNIMAVVMCIGMLIHAVESGRGRDIFDYATGLGDMVLFLIGSIYFTSGFYEDQLLQSQRLEKAWSRKLSFSALPNATSTKFAEPDWSDLGLEDGSLAISKNASSSSSSSSSSTSTTVATTGIPSAVDFITPVTNSVGSFGTCVFSLFGGSPAPPPRKPLPKDYVISADKKWAISPDGKRYPITRRARPGATMA